MAKRLRSGEGARERERSIACEAGNVKLMVPGTCEAGNVKLIVPGTCEAGGRIKPGAQAPGPIKESE
jgi:hypothetical protein